MGRLLLAAVAVSAFAALAAAQPVTPAAAPAPIIRSERGQLVLENVPETPADVRERLRQYVNARGAAFADFLPGGGVLIATRFADAAQIHAVERPMGMRRQLTFFEEPIGGADVRPGASGQWVFGKDKGGDEYFQGFLFDPAAGQATGFTEPGTRNQNLIWRDDGGLVAWSRVTKDSGDYDILVADPADPATRRVVHEGTGAIGPTDWSADGARLLLTQFISIAKSRLFTLDLATAQLTELTTDLNVSYGGGEFTPDGRSVLVSTDEGSDFQRLALIDLATGQRTVLTPDLGWDVESFDLSPNGRVIAYTVNEGGASILRLMDARTRRALPAPKLPPGVVFGLQFDEKGGRLGFTLNSATAPSDTYVYTLASRTLERWTESEVGGLDPRRFISPELARFPTFDTAAGGPKEITAWVYKPKTPGPHPVIVSIHGGPEGQSRPTFSSTIQYWVNELGFAVVLPNVRGSSGYGKTFVSLDNGVKRLDSVKDIGATLDWIGAQSDLDRQRVVAYGGSYGGYMVYASMIMFPERFAGGVDIVGISDLRTFLQNTSGYRRDLRRAEYGDERDPAIAKWMAEIAPLNNVAKIGRPMFLIHGANDPRVPLSEGEQMAKAMRANGVEVWTMVAKDEGHGFAKKGNQEAQREAETLFLRKIAGVK